MMKNKDVIANSEFPVCKEKKTNCFAFYEGFCRCLTDTNFEERACPFYKAKSVFIAQRDYLNNSKNF